MTLPADWCRANGIKVGMMIRLEEIIDLSSVEGTGLALHVVWPEENRVSPKDGEGARAGTTATQGGKG